MNKDLITMDDLTNEEILSLLDDADRLLPVAHGEEYLPLLQGKLLANMFFEPKMGTHAICSNRSPRAVIHGP